MRIKSLPYIVLLAAISFLLSSCGGSRGSEPPAPPPAPRTEPSTNPQLLPDLTIDSISREPSDPLVSPGTTLHFSIKVENRGNAPVTSFISVSAPGNYSGGDNKGLQPGATTTILVDYPVYSAGVTYTMNFMVDPDNTISESDEQNNQSPGLIVQTSS